MHLDGTEHEWATVLVLEQGEWLPAATFCTRCGLAAIELLDDCVIVDLDGLIEG